MSKLSFASESESDECAGGGDELEERVPLWVVEVLEAAAEPLAESMSGLVEQVTSEENLDSPVFERSWLALAEDEPP